MTLTCEITDSDGNAVSEVPITVRHEETMLVIRGIVETLMESGGLSAGDIPQVHRMATAYDGYLDCVAVLAERGMTSVNARGETVKRPEVNIMRDSWTQYLTIAREYGLTPRSRKIVGTDMGDDTGSPLDDFFRGD